MSIKYDLFTSPPRPGKENEHELHVRPVITGTVSTEEAAENISHATSFSSGTIHGLLVALGGEIARSLRNSHNIRLDGIGTFSVTLEGPTVKDPKEIRAEHIKVKRILFRADPDLQMKVKSSSIQRVSGIHKKGSRYPEAKRRERILWYVERYGSIYNTVVRELNNCSYNTASQDLAKLLDTGELKAIPLGKRTAYIGNK